MSLFRPSKFRQKSVCEKSLGVAPIDVDLPIPIDVEENDYDDNESYNFVPKSRKRKVSMSSTMSAVGTNDDMGTLCIPRFLDTL